MPWDANAAREVTEGSLDPLGPRSPQAVVISKLFREGAERLNRTACFQPARGGVASANEEPGDRRDRNGRNGSGRAPRAALTQRLRKLGPSPTPGSFGRRRYMFVVTVRFLKPCACGLHKR